ncbi:MAG: YbhB/YbcL family Raf kinase inhibitor-like protein [Bacteroidia bacterium]|nr:YbhB/YbcL family Raf kinase inhibitor-like protein [Bacteroidia bacterium]
MKRLAILLISIPFFIGNTFGQTFTLSTKDVGGQASLKQVFKGFGCEGENISPQLSWEHAPEGTKSFAITMYDKDAPTGSGWWHWLAFDIPASTSEIPTAAGDPARNLMPAGTIQSLTNYGVPGFGGPCPPEGHGPHQYVVTVYALNVDKLGLDANTNPAIVGYYLNNASIQKASIVFYYQR